MVMAMPMVTIMVTTVIGMLGVMRYLRNLIGMLAVDCLCFLYVDYFDYLVLTWRCLRDLMRMLALVVGCLCLLYIDCLVLTRFSVWPRTRHIGLLAGDTALRNRRGRRKRNCYCQGGSQNFLHGLS